MNILLYLWQLPQHLLGLLLTACLKAKRQPLFSHNDNRIAYRQFEPRGRFSRFFSGGSFGQYILVPPRADYRQTIPHEYGHSIQSRRWGPLYLLVIGLPSAIFNNLWDRLFHRYWTFEQRHRWYYNRYLEKQADRLGGVRRFG